MNKTTPLGNPGAGDPVRISRGVLWSAVLILLLATAAGGIYTRYSMNNPCELNSVQETSTMLVSQMNRFDNVYTSTASGTRTSITYPVSVMQQILMDTQEIDVPACMLTAKDELVSYMRDVIRAFRAFSTHEADATIQGLLDGSYAHIRNFITELEAVNKCAPSCWQVTLRQLLKK